MTSTPIKTVAALGIAAVAAVPVAAQAHAGSNPTRQETQMTGFPLVGTWRVEVTPPAPQPSFESTIAYSRGHTMAEATDKGPMSGGLGAWVRISPSHYKTTFQKYRFDSTGAYIGRTVVTEKIHVTSASKYATSAVTQIIDPAGTVLSTFTSNATASRITP
jgi:hypothetical protein